MSQVIGSGQYKSAKKQTWQYKLIDYYASDVICKKVDVKFGHPLYGDVAGIFYMESDKDEVCTVPVVPDCCTTILLRIYDDKTEGYVCGAIDSIRKIEMHPGETAVFIKFNPGIGQSLFNTSANRINNKVKDINKCISSSKQITSILKSDLPIEQIINMICMLIRMELYKEKRSYLIRFCTNKMIQSNGNINIGDLAEETGFTERHISKMFDKYVGLSPKAFAQIIKLQATMHQILSEDKLSLADIAVSNGFFDHAHMNRTYNKLIHCSSGRFRKHMFDGINYDRIQKYVE